MAKFRFGIRLKLVFFSSFLFAIPWLGYQYVWELESYLRIGQEQTMVGTARAVATALHERPALFDNQSAFLSDVKTGTDLYAYKIAYPIQLDGELEDWQDYQHLMLDYAEPYLLDQVQDYEPQSLRFSHMVGQYDRYLYAMFNVVDDHVVMRPGNSLRIDRNDHLQIAMTDENGEFQRYIVAPFKAGWVNAYLLREGTASLLPDKLETRIQGQWRDTAEGYVIELRFPLSMLSSKIAFAIIDVDDPVSRRVEYTIGTANTSQLDSLGTVLVPSPEIEKILKGLQYSNARVWVVDKHMRVLARSGQIQRSTGVQSESQDSKSQNWWSYIESEWLLPLYYQILTKPPADFIDDLKDAYALKGQDISQALQGTPSSLWRLSPDSKAVILSAAHPIYIDNKVMGAVVVEQTTNGIRTLRNKALEQQFHYFLAVILIGTLALFLMASRISWRIRQLRDETEDAIDTHGKIVGQIQPSRANDEIGDLSRTFNSVLGKLGQYNAYLENMASRLSHELRTPVAIVNSSLDNLSGESLNHESQQFVNRAKDGIMRLSKILTNMSEATRLEQAIQNNERETFDVQQVLQGCVQGYQFVYPQCEFVLKIENKGNKQTKLFGAAELFAQMLDKIIANAVDFSEKNNPIVVKFSHSDKSIKLFISNLGPVLPEKMQHQLFDSMVSIRVKQSAEQAHLGLGLYIAKIIANYHYGEINIQNRAEQDGVVVSLSFPTQ